MLRVLLKVITSIRPLGYNQPAVQQQPELAVVIVQQPPSRRSSAAHLLMLPQNHYRTQQLSTSEPLSSAPDSSKVLSQEILDELLHFFPMLQLPIQ